MPPRGAVTLPLALATLVLACVGQREQTSVQRTSGIPVRTVALRLAQRTPPIRAVGVLAGKEEVRLSFKVGGIIHLLPVDEGALVKPGQVLATLRLDEVEAGVRQTGRSLAKASRDRSRMKNLFKGAAVTREQLDSAELALEVARAAHASTRFNAHHAIIRAPGHGKIMRRFFEPGELVPPGAPILLFRTLERGWVLRVGISDRDVMRVQLGDPATVSFGALPDQSLEAAVSEVAENATTGTGTYELELQLAPGFEQLSLRSGLVGHAVIRPGATRSYAFVPLEALQEGAGNRASVFVPTRDGTKAERREVKVAYIDGPDAAISEGLEGAAAVITDGVTRLTAGARIEIVATSVTAEARP